MLGDTLLYQRAGTQHAYVPLQGGGILALRLLLEERPNLLTPERLAQMAGLTIQDYSYVQRYLSESGPWDTSQRAALLAALNAVPTLSELDWDALWEDVAP